MNVNPLSASSGLTTLAKVTTTQQPTDAQVAKATATREAFNQFVGATVFGQMLSSMRSTVGEPAYFHGGRAEEMFQSQLDQTLADEMTKSGASPFADALFKRQFPQAAEVLAGSNGAAGTAALDQLNALPRR